MGKSEEHKILQVVIDGFLQGNSAQFNIIKTKIMQYVYHQKFGADRDRDEIISEVLEIIYNNLKAGKFKGDSISALNVYIYSIIKHRVGRALRRRSRLTYDDDVLILERDPARSGSDQAEDRDLANQILVAMDEKCRKLLHLKFQRCWSDQEIADHFKKSKNATSTAISRCLKKAQELEIVQELL